MNKIKIAKKGQIDIYSSFISSLYFSSFNDLKNLILSSPRHQYLLEKYYFNPIPIKETERKFYINLQTLHLYNKNENEYLEDKKIKKRVYWYEITYDEYIKNTNNNENNEYKKILFTKKDKEQYGKELPQNIYKICDNVFTFEKNEISITGNTNGWFDGIVNFFSSYSKINKLK